MANSDQKTIRFVYGDRAVYKEIGAVFKRIREEKGLSLEDVAGLIGYPKGGDASGLQRMEKGEKRVFLDLYWQVAQALDVPLHRIIREAESPQAASDKVYSPQETGTVNCYLAMTPPAKDHVDYLVAAIAANEGKSPPKKE